MCIFDPKRKSKQMSGKTSRFKKLSWKMVGGIFLYYLVRDTLLYIVLPLSLGWYSFDKSDADKSSDTVALQEVAK